MASGKKSWSRIALVTLLLGAEGGRAAALAGNPFIRRVAPKSCLEMAAEQIDRLEHKLQNEGSIVVKAPDVWGESRLTKHRQEFERVLESRINDFQLLLNGSIRRSDQAFLANTLAIQAALPGGERPSVSDAKTDLSIVNQLAPTTAASASPTDTPITRSLVAAAGVSTTRFVDSFEQNSVLDVGLEPTIALDQLKRYLDHLNEIRRVNEGDDTSDSPGYSLNLVRIPVSILPGDRTRKGYGAEVTVTAIPHLSSELLPRVFRELVINDLVDILGTSTLTTAEPIDVIAFGPQSTCEPRPRELQSPWKDMTESDRIRSLLIDEGSPDGSATLPSIQPVHHLQSQVTHTYSLQFQQKYGRNLKDWTAKRGSTVNPSSASASRNARQPMAPTQSIAVMGQDELIILAYEFWKGHTKPIARHLPDARSFLREQLQAGYDYLTTPEGLIHWSLIPQIHQAIRTDDVHTLDMLRMQVFKPYHVKVQGAWQPVCGVPSPVTACAWWILVESALLNQQLNDDIKRVSQDPECQCQCTEPLAFYSHDPPIEARLAFIDYVKCRWPIHVFALDPVVQEQNIADQFSLRRELQLALAMSFASGRSSIQNVTRYARRLEMDMETIALNRTHIAFGHGSDTFGWRFMPRVQSPPFEGNAKVLFRDLLIGGPTKDQITHTWELEGGQRECVAIVLMPSFIEHVTFQSRGNFFRLADCRVDGLPPKDLRSKVADNVRWSEEARILSDTLNQLHCEADRFLPGEIDRVQARATQLTRRFPLQTVHSRVPNENTLGGFEMFSSGVTDLAPELLDFYGEPGIDVTKDTSLFLVGNHFSVHDTHVIVGHRECDFELVSREIMKVNIPAGVHPALEEVESETCRRYVVDVHVATPYGVTSHLHIPVIDAPACPEPRLEWVSREIPIRMPYVATPGMNSKTTYDIPLTGILLQPPHELAMTVPPYSFAAEQTFNVEVVMNADRSTVQIAELTGTTAAPGPFTKVPFNGARRQFVVSGGNYGEVIKRIRTGVVALLNTLPAGASPPEMLDLQVLGRLPDGTEIDGGVHFLIRLEQAQ